MTRPRVYAAHPVVTYGTARERDCLASLRGLLPDVDLYDPAGTRPMPAGCERGRGCSRRSPASSYSAPAVVSSGSAAFVRSPTPAG